MSAYSCVTLIMLNSFLEVCDLHDTVMEILYVSVCAYVSLQVSLLENKYFPYLCVAVHVSILVPVLTLA